MKTVGVMEKPEQSCCYMSALVDLSLNMNILGKRNISLYNLQPNPNQLSSADATSV